MGVIYMITSPSDKKYIGQHITEDFNNRKKSHCKKFLKFKKRKLYIALERKFNPDKIIPFKLEGCCTALYSAFMKYGFNSFRMVCFT